MPSPSFSSGGSFSPSAKHALTQSGGGASGGGGNGEATEGGEKKTLQEKDDDVTKGHKRFSGIVRRSRPSTMNECR